MKKNKKERGIYETVRYIRMCNLQDVKICLE